MPLDDAGGPVEELALEPHTELGVDELALDELEEDESLGGVAVPVAVCVLPSKVTEYGVTVIAALA